MKILVADKFDDAGLEQLKALATDLRHDAGLKGDTLTEAIHEFQPNILIVRSTKVPGTAMSAAEPLEIVIRAGSGFDNIDVSAASQQGIQVCNCPGMNRAAVAELVIGLMCCLDRRIPDNVADLRAGIWNKKGYSKARGLKGHTLGVVGAGAIGEEVVRRALAFDMEVLFTHLGRTRRLVDYPNCRRTEFEELLRGSDFVSLHVPGGETTEALIGETQLRMMRPGAFLINTSRPTVVDQAALQKALEESWIAGAAADVYANEPPADAKEIDTPLAKLPNFYGTHHIGASTEQAQMAVAEEAIRIVREYKASGKVLNCVNVSPGKAACQLVIRLVNKPGALAHVFDQLSRAEINVEEMDHVIYEGGAAASAHIRLDKRPDDDILKRIREAPASQVIGLDVLTV
jgi:D-3-phosphoglycerate dehydrogenase / 2-oxoglutarate reductase